MRKKKILISSNFSKKNTGFAKAKKNLLLGLYATGKYEIVELANGEPYGKTFSTPWKTIGTYPSDAKTQKDIQDGKLKSHDAAYGGLLIDKIIADERPEIYLGIEDCWAFGDFEIKPWWNQLTPIVWTTLDSLPILNQAFDLAENTKNFFVWAKFAEREMKLAGAKNVRTLHGPIDHTSFKKLSDIDRAKNRKRFGLTDEFIVGFVFRNQLRKSVPNLLDGFIRFKQKNPVSKAKLLLHTSFAEGWDIPKLMKERGISDVDVLTTYYCGSCKNYSIKPYSGNVKTCHYCGGNEMSTTNINSGVNESQLNEIYNLMDVYCHPFTSGGQEIPVQEAKMCELITLVTNYSCGEEYCTDESGGLPLSWSEYREQGSEFIKATTSPESISNQLSKVFNMTPKRRATLGKKARDFISKNFSIQESVDVISKIIDEAPFVDKITVEKEVRDQDFIPEDDLSNEEWVESVFKNMLKRSVSYKHRNCAEVLKTLSYGAKREDVLEKLKELAKRENLELRKKSKISDFLDKDDKGRRIAVMLPQSAGDVFLSTAILRSIKDRYPDHNIYYFTKKQYHDLLDDCPYVHKCIEYHPQLDNPLFLEGKGKHEGEFEVCYRLHVMCQMVPDFSKNGKDIIDLDLKY